MSVVGLDIGNENCAIAVAKRGGVDVLLNDESKRETPAVVSFGEKQRFLGSAGAAFATTNLKSTISQIKRLIGKLYNDPSVQEDLRLLPFDTSCESSDGVILIHIQYLSKIWTFMPVEILGMLFAHLKQVIEKNIGSQVVDCVIGIPSYFTDFQRREYLDAAYIAGLRPLKLMHDCTAVALGYGMYKTDFSNKRRTNVIFVDIGHSDTQVSVAAFEKGKMTILSHSFDQNLGGRDFDEVLFRHFASKFKDQYNIDVCSDSRASIRLRASCEKLKKVLSANVEAQLSIECLVDDKDAVYDYGLSVDDEIHSIELVGSGSRIPAIMRKLTSVFGKEPMRTLNGSECVARGCALSCAMLSPTFRVQDYKFFYTNNMDFLVGVSPDIGYFMIGPSQPPTAEKVVLKVKMHLNINGIVETESALVSNLLPKLPKYSTWVNLVLMWERPYVFFYSWLHILEDKNLDNTLTDCKRTGSSLSTSHYVEEARKGWVRRQNLPVSKNLDVVIMKDELNVIQGRLQMFEEHDIRVEKTKEIRNILESFIYDTRTKFQSSYRSVTTDLEAEEIIKRLQGTEDWLYEDGDDESEQVYIGKLKDLKKLLHPIENRYKDETARKEVTKALHTCIQENRLAADSLPPSQKKEV
uniref:Uncharacterized protein n=1 Tax=Lactuca sativa TaxID=4236 RepID=A0A9R1VQ02_LACSA|nr:hypothetical protein LSAT_V11C400223190 [Lactuca sativa]